MTPLLKFTRAAVEHRSRLLPYLFAYGENSCQHSFAAMVTMQGKYADSFCEKDGWLYLLRAKKETSRNRVYLLPMGDRRDEPGFCRAIKTVLEDAHYYGKRAVFSTVTLSAAQQLRKLFPGVFSEAENRDLSEYLYTYTRLADLPGKAMSSKRYDVHTFYRDFGDRVRIETITPELIPAIREFQAYWLHLQEKNGRILPQLEWEDEAIQLGLDNYQALGLSGIVIYIDDRICGYVYGTQISADGYDVIIEKGDPEIPDIYRILNQEIVRRCCTGLSWINREEDLGEPGLRRAKMSYHPDRLLEKLILTEEK